MLHRIMLEAGDTNSEAVEESRPHVSRLLASQGFFPFELSAEVFNPSARLQIVPLDLLFAPIHSIHSKVPQVYIEGALR